MYFQCVSVRSKRGRAQGLEIAYIYFFELPKKMWLGYMNCLKNLFLFLSHLINYAYKCLQYVCFLYWESDPEDIYIFLRKRKIKSKNEQIQFTSRCFILHWDWVMMYSVVGDGEEKSLKINSSLKDCNDKEKKKKKKRLQNNDA